jgi:hypothetical protein
LTCGILGSITIALFVFLATRWKNCTVETDDQGISIFGFSGRLARSMSWVEISDVSLSQDRKSLKPIVLNASAGKIAIGSDVQDLKELRQIIKSRTEH